MRAIQMITLGAVLSGMAGWLAPGAVVAVAAAQTAAPSALRMVTLKVGNMDCAACRVIVRRTLAAVEGVRSAKVSYSERTAVVTFDPSRCDASDLVAATARYGYPSTVVR